MTDTRWKRHEREIAAAMGGIRLPNVGRGQPDIIAGNVAVQVKTRKVLPSWLTDAVDQAAQDAPDGAGGGALRSHTGTQEPAAACLGTC